MSHKKGLLKLAQDKKIKVTCFRVMIVLIALYEGNMIIHSQAEIARFLDVDPRTANKAIKVLEEGGYIKRIRKNKEYMGIKINNDFGYGEDNEMRVKLGIEFIDSIEKLMFSKKVED